VVNKPIRTFKINGKRKVTRLYNIWGKMKSRCYYNPEKGYNKDYQNYGGLGVTVCELWKKDYEAFYKWSMANGYSSDLSLDRIDSSGNYCPNNCRWADKWMQTNNRKCTVMLTYKGVEAPLSWWARKSGLKTNTLWKRIYHSGWSVEKAIETKVTRKGETNAESND